MPPKVKKRWYHRWLTFRVLRRAMLVLLVVGAASVGMFLLGSRSERLREKERQHAFIARQLRLKAEIAALLADADPRTDYVMVYHYTCNVLAQYDVASLEEPDQLIADTNGDCAVREAGETSHGARAIAGFFGQLALHFQAGGADAVGACH